jgi:hypothetical protein
MKTRIIAFAIGSALSFSADAAPVEWDFIATGCAQGGGCLSGQHYPVILATLTLPGLDSSGTAKYEGAPGHVPIYTGDSFVLNWDEDYHPPLLSPAFQAGPFTPCEPGQICNFDLSWSETGGQLTALSLHVQGLNLIQGLDPVIGDVLGFTDTFSSSLNGAEVASTSPKVPFLRYSDFIYDGAGGLFHGCEGAPCQLSGSWVDAPAAVPEPGMLGVLLVGLLGLFGVRRA